MDDYRKVRFDGKRYPVIEIFTSIQFEGFRVGTLTHFLRLGGCNFNCLFCDTDMSQYTMMTPDEILEKLEGLEENSPAKRRLVITGGEPFVHDLFPLLKTLPPAYYIAVETNGSLLPTISHNHPKVLDLIQWITASPKGFVPEDILRNTAHELKYIIPDAEELILHKHPRVFLQPEFNNPESVERCIKLLSQYPHFRMSVQAHKYLGLR